jgi:DNA-binding CsgD family transcriptional regulator
VSDLLLEGLAALAEGRLAEGARPLRLAVAAMTGGQPVPDDAPLRFLAFRLAVTEVYDDTAWRELAGRWVAQARDRGAIGAMVVGLEFQARGQLAEGRLAAARGTISEARTLAEAMDSRPGLDGLAGAELEVRAWCGDRAARARPLAVLELGLGNYQAALALAAAAGPPSLVYQSSPDVLIEAAIRCGDRDAAAAALESVAPWWQACGTPWSLGLLARGQALLAGDDDAEDRYRRSVEHLRRVQVTPQLARSHLLYGEWLRRQRRRRGAREQLRTASELFGAMGMEAFAGRAQAGLRAVGEYAAARRAGTADTLTAQEAQIARLAADGATNQEIASRLFVSASTVDYHLRKVFRKLGITSRGQLSRALSDASSP